MLRYGFLYSLKKFIGGIYCEWIISESFFLSFDSCSKLGNFFTRRSTKLYEYSVFCVVYLSN